MTSRADTGRFGKYQLLQRIAAGGMGEVYLAKLKGPAGFEKLVVIKKLLDHRNKEQKYIDMFFAEARVAAQLNHSNIAQVYEVGKYDGMYYIAMEYVQGKSLKSLIDANKKRQTSLPPIYVAQIFIELCAGLSFAHNARHLSGATMGLIHRDINPHNILLSYSGDVKIIDFGIAKSELTLDQTQAGTIKGTVVYMSPEQSMGLKLDKRSDLFSVGICLYEVLTGHNPFHKDNLAASLEAIRQATYPSLAAEDPHWQGFAPLIARCLARQPNDRFSDCADLAAGLQVLLDSNQLVRADKPLSLYLSELFAQDIHHQEGLLGETEVAEWSDLYRRPEQLQPNDEYTVVDIATLKTKISSFWQQWFAVLFNSQHNQIYWQRWGKKAPLWLQQPIVRKSALVGAVVVSLSLIGYLIGSTQKTPSKAAVGSVASAPPTPIVKNSQGLSPEHSTPELADNIVEPKEDLGDVGSPHHLTKQHPNTTVHPHPKLHPLPKVEKNNLLGVLHVQTEPVVRVIINGTPVGESLQLKNQNGTLQIGTGSNPLLDPFVIHVAYRLVNQEIFYSLEAYPWAHVSGAGGVLLGRTPLNRVQGSSLSIFEFSHPHAAGSIRLTLRFLPSIQ